jgi:hypothetical protein
MLGVEPMNLLLVVGGYNSSNTSHLAEMGEAVLPTYFIKNSDKLISPKEISHYDQHKQQEVVSHDWLPEGNVVVGITAGASCPNNLLEETIHRQLNFRHPCRAPVWNSNKNLSGRLLAPYAQFSGDTAAANTPNRPRSGARNTSATATGSFIRAPFAGWNTRRRFFSTAPAIICARG